MQRVTSPDNPRLKAAQRLSHSARERRKLDRCVLEGTHLVEDYLERFGAPETCIVDEGALERPEVAGLLARIPGPRVLAVPSRLFAEVALLASPAGVIAVVPTPKPAVVAQPRFALLLDGIQDPGNLGTILRTAAAAGVDQVHLSRDCAFPWAPKTLRAGQGGHFRLSIHDDADLAEVARRFAGRVVAAVVRDGVPLYAADLDGPVALMIGAEGQGLSAELAALADVRASVPMPGGTESLNAAVAAALFLFEKVRQDAALTRSPGRPSSAGSTRADRSR